MNPGTITQIFYELGSTPDIKQMSPLLKHLMNGVKLKLLRQYIKHL